MRDPADTATEAARDAARGLLGFYHRYGALDPGDDHMRALARTALMHAGLPDRVLDYVLRRLDEKPSKRGGGRPSNVSRDFWIVQTVACVAVGHGLWPTRRRGRAHRRPSACAVVAQVLGELGMELDEGGVEAVWGKRRPRRSPREIADEWRMPANVVSPEEFMLAKRRRRA